MNLDEIPSDLAVQLAVLEMRRKYPDLSGKGAALIWNDQDNEISFRNFFPLSVIKKQKIKDLRREVMQDLYLPVKCLFGIDTKFIVKVLS